MLKFDYLTLCLFALRIGKSGEKWRVAYGIITPAHEKMDSPILSGSSQIGTYSKGKLSMRKVIWVDEQDTILGIYEDLAKGISLKNSFDKWGIDISSWDFDVVYSQEAIDEPWGAEHILTNQMSYSRSICMLNPLKLFEKDNEVPNDAEKALEIIEKYLRNQTYLPFGDKYDHVGNLDIVISPDRDAMGKPLVETRWEKGNPFVQHVKLHKELVENDDELLINIICKQDGRIIKDSVERILVNVTQEVEREYTMDDCPDSIEVKIWRIRDGQSMVVSDTSHYFLKQIYLSMGVMEGRMSISTKWLENIRQSLPEKRRGDVDNATIVDRSEQMQTIIGEQVKKRVQRKKRLKSNDEFFPKGWDAEEEEHGLLSFLDWFKRKAKGTKHVFLQDPYFEDVAMYFLASVDVCSDYTVLTQTQLKTNPDGTIKEAAEDDTGGRKDKIIEGINANPRMFGPMKLVILDIPISHNVMHDRYLIFDYGDSNVEAYTLSNSLQGATNKQPLLVTQIGETAFEKVSTHIQKTLNREGVTTIYNYAEVGKNQDEEEVDKVADGNFLKILRKQKKELEKGSVNQVLEDIKTSNTHKRLATLGYFLASIDDENAHLILKNLASEMAVESEWVDILKSFILDCYNANYPIGYNKTPFRGRWFYDPTSLLSLNYNQIVSSYNTHIFNCIGSEGHSFGVYGHYFAAKLLLKLSVKEYVNVIKQLRPKLLSVSTDKTTTPCYKVMGVLMAELLEYDYWSGSDDIKCELLADKEDWCRGVGALIFLQKAKEEDFKCGDFRYLFKDEEEMVILCHAACGMKPAPAHMDVFYKWLIEVFNDKGDKTYFTQRLIGEILGEAHFMDDKIDYMQHVTLPLISTGLVNKDELSKELIESLYDNSINGKHTLLMRDVLPECLFIVGGDIGSLYEKAKDTVEGMKTNIKKITVKSEDNIFGAAKDCIELRVVIKHLLEKYKGLTNETLEKLKLLLEDLDQTLDGFGLERAKWTFENLK